MLNSWVLDWFIIMNIATLACGMGGLIVGALRKR